MKRGSEAAYRAVEEDAARICAELNFPHAHVAIESLTGPKEVWWLNGFESGAEQQQVTREYAGNRPPVQALGDIGKRKEALTGTPVDTITSYRADLSRGAPGRVAGARFVVVTVTRRDPWTEGSDGEGAESAVTV